MDPFEYTVILTSLIIGLGIAQLLQGTADILSGIKHVKFSWPLILMVCKCFLLCVQDWWINYQYAEDVPMDSWSIRMVLFVLVYPTFLFIWARMLFPTGLRSEETDLDAYFFDQWRSLYTVELLTIVLSIFQNLFIDNYSLMSQLPLIGYEFVFMLVIALNVKNKNFHLGFQIATLIVVSLIVFVQDEGLVDYTLP